jgi:oligoendopeptidase F
MKLTRKYLPENLIIEDWQSVQTYFEELLNREIKSVKALKLWLKDRSELESVLQEDMAWRYIKMNCNTQDETLSKHFEVFVTKIEPKISEIDFELNKKLYNNKYINELTDSGYDLYFRLVKNKIDLFRPENIPIQAELQKEEQEYGRIASEMTIKYKGQEITLHNANNFLKETDRTVREEVYKLVWDRRLKDSKALDELFCSLFEKRQKIARNAGFKNYIEYMFRKLGRFDYKTEDCYRFQETIKSEVVPIVDKIRTKKKEKLGIESLRPWDLEVDEDMEAPLKPFSKASELISGTVECFSRINPRYADFISIMDKGSFLDLESRFGKAPGGFNYPLHESNIPFIFMNATGNLRDVETMVHEGGHAIHSFLTKDLELSSFKETPMEVAELASMTMELISMEHWEPFFKKPDELKRAKIGVLKGTIQILPWVAMIDKFQHLIYLENDLNTEFIRECWQSISDDFYGNVLDWNGLEPYRDYSWQKQLHLFEVPFYYIEYGFAQLGAIAIWRNYKLNPKKALLDYENALKLGYTKSIPEIYKTAGIEFNFSKEYVRELMQFVLHELDVILNG